MRKVILTAAVILGLSAAVIGPVLAIVFVIIAGRGAGALDGVVAATIALAFAVVGIGLGLPLALSAYRALQGRPARHWRMPGWGWWFVAFVAVLFLGQAALAAGLSRLIPVLHVLAAVLPPLLVVSLATRRGRDLTGRQISGGLGWGGLASTAIAISLELAFVVAGVLAVFAWLNVINPGLLEQLQELALEMQSSGEPGDFTAIADLVASPLIMMTALGSISIVVPVIEEAVKGLIVPLVMLAGATPTRRQAFLLGVASGAGFALFEGILNGALGLMSHEGWAGLMFVRGATAAVHAFATGLIALGWQAILVERRWSRGFALGLLGVAVHSVWNLGAGLEALTAFISTVSEMPAAVTMLMSAWAFTLMALVLAASIVSLVFVSRQNPDPSPTTAPSESSL